MGYEAKSILIVLASIPAIINSIVIINIIHIIIGINIMIRGKPG